MAFNPDKCLSIKNVGPSTVAVTAGFSDLLEYSFDGNEWNVMGAEIVLNSGEKVYLKGDPNFETEGEPFRFDGPGVAIELGGNVMSLLGDESGEATVISNSNTFSRLFAGTPIVNIPEGFLPATTLASYCYEAMFAGCEQLIDLPGNLLPATDVPYECYQSMFEESGVATIGENFIAGTSFGQEACYGMFRNTKVESIPATLFCGTEISTGMGAFSSMFHDCAKLTSIPANLLSNIKHFAPQACNGMFGSSGITELPVGFIPESGLGVNIVFNTMFAETPITKVPKGFFPDKSGSNNEYSQMFALCSDLNEIHVPFTDWGIVDGSPMTDNWVMDVAATGDFYGPEGLEEIYGDSYIPRGWEYHVEEPEDTKVHGSVTFVGQVRASIR